jgi:lipid-A-disaccharide synthase
MKIALIAGEASGDVLAAALMAALRERRPGARFIGMGGPKMQAEGLDSWFDYSALSLFGFAEVITHLPGLFRLRRQLLQRLTEARPDVVIGIDAPDFNFGLERRCRQAGLPVVHFPSPSIWAWRQNRAAAIAQSCDLMLCLFPMEPAIYAQYGLKAAFVGHPLADQIPLVPDRSEARQALGLPDAPCLALLPGSRLSEIRRLLPDFIAAAHLLQLARPMLQIVVPAADARCRAEIESALRQRPLPNATVLDGNARTAMIASDAVLLASGTATLEAALCKRPMVVAYKVNPASLFVAQSLGMLKTRRFSLPNILAGRDLVPELLQGDCTPAKLAAALTGMLDHPGAQSGTLDAFHDIHLQLKQGAAGLAADAILELLAGRPAC